MFPEIYLKVDLEFHLKFHLFKKCLRDKPEFSRCGNVVNASSCPLILIQAEFGDFLLTLDISIKISTDLESIPLEQIVNKLGEKIWLLGAE